MTTFNETDTFGLGITSPLAANWIAHNLSTNGLRLGTVGGDAGGWRPAWGYSLSNGLGLHPTQSQIWQFVRIIEDTLGLHRADTEKLTYHMSNVDALKLHDAFIIALPVFLSHGLGLSQVQKIVQAVIVVHELALRHVQTPVGRYHQNLVSLIALHDALGQFFGLGLTSGLGLHATPSTQFTGVAHLSNGFGLHDVLGQSLIWRVVEQDDLGLSDEQIINQIFTMQLSDGLEFSVAVVDPGGGFTTWAVNTRTGAVTEYENWVFNSFAPMGVKYLGANSSGVYELNGPDDNGAQIIADLMGGQMQIGGSKFTAFKSAYLGVRGGGGFVLKLVSGDGKTFTYDVSTQDMRTSRVNMGKGLRARYFAYELTSTGQDFDLDSIEFVPLISTRRI
jgi:hypothetical protein